TAGSSDLVEPYHARVTRNRICPNEGPQKSPSAQVSAHPPQELPAVARAAAARSGERPGIARGTANEKVEPRPGSLRTRSWPPWASTMLREMKSPSPVPPPPPLQY